MRAAVLLAVLVAAPVAAAERPNDKDVKQLLDRIYQERDRFEDQLDGQLKHSTLRGPQGEVAVDQYLDDLQENCNRLKDRFNGDYAASAEATTVLRQGSDIQRFMAGQPPNFKGASEWNRLAASLGELAAAYGTTFPLAEGAAARRVNDREMKQTAEDVANAADRFKKELDSSLKQDKSVDQATRENALKDVDGVKNAAKALASRVGDGNPASGEAKTLVDRVAATQASSTVRPLSPAAKTAVGFPPEGHGDGGSELRPAAVARDSGLGSKSRDQGSGIRDHGHYASRIPDRADHGSGSLTR